MISRHEFDHSNFGGDTPFPIIIACSNNMHMDGRIQGSKGMKTSEVKSKKF